VRPPAEGEIAFRDDPTGAIPSAELTAPLRQFLRFPNGIIALIPAGNPVDIPMFEPGKTGDAARIRNIPLANPLTGEAIVFAGGLLAPTEGGQVLLLDARTGAEIAAPFQPPLEAGRKYRWSRPAILGTDRFVIADDSGGVHLAVVKDAPAKHLDGAATSRLDDPVESPLAVLDNRVYAVDRRDSLVRLDLPGLTEKAQQPLGAKCVLGPFTIGEHVMLVTNDDLMHVIDSSGKMRSDKLPYGAPTGEPLVDGSHWLLAAASGEVWRVDPASGEELAKEQTGLALGSGLALFDNRLLVAGHDGTLYLIEKP
jgi:outer membrane protein assembly factor BamB